MIRAGSISLYVAAAGPDGWDRIVTTLPEDWPTVDEHPAPLRGVVEKLGAGIDYDIARTVQEVFLSNGASLARVGEEWAELVRRFGHENTVASVRSLARDHLRFHGREFSNLRRIE